MHPSALPMVLLWQAAHAPFGRGETFDGYFYVYTVYTCCVYFPCILAVYTIHVTFTCAHTVYIYLVTPLLLQTFSSEISVYWEDHLPLCGHLDCAPFGQHCHLPKSDDTQVVGDAFRCIVWFYCLREAAKYYLADFIFKRGGDGGYTLNGKNLLKVFGVFPKSSAV